MVPSEIADWRKRMGVKEARLKELREQRQLRGTASGELPDQRTDVATSRAGGDEPPALNSPGQPLPGSNRRMGDGPRAVDPPVASRGPWHTKKDKTLATLEPWKAAGVSRRTWFRHKGKPDVKP